MIKCGRATDELDILFHTDTYLTDVPTAPILHAGLLRKPAHSSTTPKAVNSLTTIQLFPPGHLRIPGAPLCEPLIYGFYISLSIYRTAGGTTGVPSAMIYSPTTPA